MKLPYFNHCYPKSASDGSLLQYYGSIYRSKMMRPLWKRLTRNAFSHKLFLPFTKPVPQLFLRPSFPFSKDESNLAEREKLGAYEEYIINLKDFRWVSRHLNRIQYLLGYSQTPKNLNYGHLRSVINELLLLCNHATNARSYHSQLNFDAAVALKQIAEMVKLTFSEVSNISHESINDEGKSSYEFIEFPAYFHICNSWNTAIDREVLAFYLHSYMNLLFDRSFLKYISVFDVLRESEPLQISQQIINKSIEGILLLMNDLKDKIGRSDVLNPYEAAVYLKYLINNRTTQRSVEQVQDQILTLHNYIINSPRKFDVQLVHCQNITYSLYLLFSTSSMSPHFLSTIQWQCSRLQEMATHQRQDQVMQYLTCLTSHQDKITCLKVDIWLTLLTTQRHHETHQFDVRPHIESILLTIHSLSFQFWRYKYVFWLMDSLLNKYPGNSLHIIKRISSFLPFINFQKYDKISAAAIFVGQITQRFKYMSDIMGIHEFIASWLMTIPRQSLKAQIPSDLCDVLSTADSHPSLQALYTPYLCILLELSLGHFHWKELTRLYYYGLRFGVEMHSEEAKWNMEYVRRYILNQYATMGLRRRQIPEDSYFYKIIGITTPQKFYQNYLKVQ